MKHSVTTMERIETRFGKVTQWRDQVAGEMSAPRQIIAGVDGALHLIDFALADEAKPVISESLMVKLNERLSKAGVSSKGLPKADPRMIEKPTVVDEAADTKTVSAEEVRQAFFSALRGLRPHLRTVRRGALADVNALLEEQRQLTRTRKSLGSLLRNRIAGTRAALEQMAKGGPKPFWIDPPVSMLGARIMR